MTSKSSSESLNPGHELTLATRGSKLALWQAQHVQALLADEGVQTKLEIVRTLGDRSKEAPLHEIGGKGVFVREIEQALIDGRADLAVHSLKDLPVRGPKGLELSALLPRDPAGDVMIFPGQPSLPAQPLSAEDLKTIFTEKPNAIIATGSLRRAALLQNTNPNLKVEPIRGNVDTRIRKLQSEARWDALILAEASITRLQMQKEVSYACLAADWFTPSPAQGVLAVQCRKDSEAAKLLAKLNCQQTQTCAQLERRVLELLGGDCTLPIGVHARWLSSQELTATASVLNNKGKQARAQIQGSPTSSGSINKLAHDLTQQLISHGVNEILQDLGLPTLLAIPQV